LTNLTAPLKVTLAGSPLTLLPERAVFCPTERVLLVSDVHLGKAETFQRYGVPVPGAVNGATLNRLAQVCDRTQARRLIILGDLFHAQAGMVDEVIDAWLAFLHHTGVQAELILGNHDRPLIETLAQLSLICWAEPVPLGAAILSHEPLANGEALNVCGHIHPCVRLGQRRDRLRLPCFHWQMDRRCLTLPAFGEFTGGYDVRLGRGHIAYAIAEGQVIPLP
jgi:DNA ligase-associated metallophosphoesterase